MTAKTKLRTMEGKAPAWETVAPGARRSKSGPMALRVYYLANGANEGVCRGYLTMAAYRYFRELECSHVIVQIQRDGQDRPVAIRLVGAESDRDGNAFWVRSDRTIGGSAFVKLGLPEMTIQLEPSERQGVLVGEIPRVDE